VLNLNNPALHRGYVIEYLDQSPYENRLFLVSDGQKRFKRFLVNVFARLDKVLTNSGLFYIIKVYIFYVLNLGLGSNE